MEFGAFMPKHLTSDGNSFIDWTNSVTDNNALDCLGVPGPPGLPLATGLHVTTEA